MDPEKTSTTTSPAASVQQQHHVGTNSAAAVIQQQRFYHSLPPPQLNRIPVNPQQMNPTNSPQIKVTSPSDQKNKNSKVILVNGVALEISVQGLLEKSEFKINFDLEKEILYKYYNKKN